MSFQVIRSRTFRDKRIVSLDDCLTRLVPTHTDLCIVQFIHNHVQGFLEERGLTCEDVTQDELHGVAEDSASYVMKASCNYPN